jgi:hypothetical protein
MEVNDLSSDPLSGTSGAQHDKGAMFHEELPPLASG